MKNPRTRGFFGALFFSSDQPGFEQSGFLPFVKAARRNHRKAISPGTSENR
jgi:hypothetical protein